MTDTNPNTRRALRLVLIVAIGYLALLVGQPAGLDLGRIVTDVATTPTNIIQQLIIGLANGSNAIAIVVPCHRVIGANGSLTGYAGGLDRKHFLLRHEAAAAGR